MSVGPDSTESRTKSDTRTRYSDWRSALVRGVFISGVSVLGACYEYDGAAPRLVTIELVSGNNQLGHVGGLLSEPLKVRVVDEEGAPAADAVVTFEATTGGGTVTPTSATSDADGYAVATWRLGPLLGPQTASAKMPGLTPITFTAEASPAPASALTVTNGADQTGRVGQRLPLDISVEVSDAFGNPTAGIPVSFTVLSGGGTVSSANVVSDENGLAAVAWTMGHTAGTQTLLAGSGAITPVAIEATATPDNPVSIIVLSGGDQAAAPNSPLPDEIVVLVADQYGNGVTGQTVTWTLPADGGSLNAPSTATDNLGRAAVRWTLGPNRGPVELVASSGSLRATIIGAGFMAFTAVDVGGGSACGFGPDGVLYCWGSNVDGQLGIGPVPAGSDQVYPRPQAVAPVGSNRYQSVTAGRFHGCSVTTSQIGFCWGANYSGQLGTGSTAAATLPSAIGLGTALQTISAGRNHTCGVTTGGRPYCWGDNDRGQLGGNVTVNGGSGEVTLTSSSSPVQVGRRTDGTFFGTFDFIAIAAGGLHTCAIDFNRQAFCWGMGSDGQRGDGSNTVQEYVPQPVSGGIELDSITAGQNHSCALTTAGAALCWGANTEGQLGDGIGLDSSVPSPVGGGKTFVAVSAGDAHTCGLAVGGAIYCWGRNTEGQLGTGFTVSADSPQLVVGNLSFRSVSAGGNSTCGVTTAGVAYCWGDNANGSLGDGSRTNRAVPTKVAYQP